MKYAVTIDGRVRTVELAEGGGAPAVSVDGRRIKLDLAQVNGAGEVRLVVDGRPATVTVSRRGGGFDLLVGGAGFEASVGDERSERLKRLARAGMRKGGHDGEIRAPMPGLVVKINATVGERVAKGQKVIVVEAMKMENEVASPVEGVVEKVMFEAGRAVGKGDVLMVIAAR